jgi:hypothetical protein
MSNPTTAAPVRDNIICSTLLTAYQISHEWLAKTMADVTPEVAHWQPPGHAHTIISNFMHHTCGAEDFLLNQLVKGAQPLMMTVNAGLSEPLPMDDWAEWAQRLKVDLTAALPYAKQVFANTEDLLASMTDEDLQKPVDMSWLGMGMQTARTLFLMVLMDCNLHMGEISCVKGLQGLRGYPF